MNGLEMLLKTFGLDPGEMRKSVEEFRTLVLRLATAVEHVGAQQRIIMAHLNIPDAPTEQNHGNGKITGGEIVNPGTDAGSPRV